MTHARMTHKLHPGEPFPGLSVSDDDGQQIDIAIPSDGAEWRMLVVYRGRHCPMCTRYLNTLNEFRERLLAIGIDLVAVSADSRAQLDEHRERLNVDFPLFHGLTLEQMTELGLYISIPRSAQETDHDFAEPAVFVINDQGRIQVVDLSNNPFARPDPETFVSGLEWIRSPENSYPVRGTRI